MANEGLDDLNSLAQVLFYKKSHWDLATAVIQYADVKSSQEMQAVIKGMAYFVYLTGPVSDSDIGKHFVIHEPDYLVPKPLLDFIDLTRVGQFICKEHCGKDIRGNFVCLAPGHTLDRILRENYYRVGIWW